MKHMMLMLAAGVALVSGNGVSPTSLEAESGSVLRFVNTDVRPHQIYSNDCAGLSSTVIAPGEGYAVAVPPGSRVCHFQDLLGAPGAWTGTLQVHDRDEEQRVQALGAPQG